MKGQNKIVKKKKKKRLYAECLMRYHHPCHQEQVIIEKVATQTLNFPRESCTKYESLSLCLFRHPQCLHNFPDVYLKSHVKHCVSVIQNQKLNILQGNPNTNNEMNQINVTPYEKCSIRKMSLVIKNCNSSALLLLQFQTSPACFHQDPHIY